MSRRIGIIAAMRAELAPLVAGWTPAADGVWKTRRGEADLVAAARGMGAARAEQAVLAAEAVAASSSDGGPLTALVSVGWAGASTCGVFPGSAYVVGAVHDLLTGQRYATVEATNPVLLVTADHVAGRKEKHSFAVDLGASLVDMEAATVARMAQERNIPFYCWKAITDSNTEDLPDFAPFLDGERQLQIGRLATYAVTHPRVVPALLRMGRNGRSGAIALRDTLNAWIDQGASGGA